MINRINLPLWSSTVMRNRFDLAFRNSGATINNRISQCFVRTVHGDLGSDDPSSTFWRAKLHFFEMRQTLLNRHTPVLAWQPFVALYLHLALLGVICIG